MKAITPAQIGEILAEHDVLYGDKRSDDAALAWYEFAGGLHEPGWDEVEFLAAYRDRENAG